jgi:tripartite-type tricarboxylate transporter receptor subunit TctC
MLTRRRLALSAAGTLAAPAVLAQPRYPVQTVTLVTHSSPGGGSDIFLRELIKHLQPVMGVSFAVENVRGGSGATAVARVARSQPNGGMFYATTPTYIQTTLLSRPEFGYDSLDPLSVVFLDPQLIYTRAQSPFQTLGEAMAAARKNPGRQKWGAANPASLERIALERLNRMVGARAAVVPHEGGGDLMINVLNGTLDIGIGEIQEINAQLEAGRIRLLGVLTENRLETIPALATAREQGIDLVVTKFRGLAGPKGMPDEIAAQWATALRAVLDSPAYREIYAKESLVATPQLLPRPAARSFTTDFAAEIATSLRELGVVR